MAASSLITLVALAASFVAVQCMSKPGFCKGYDCPLFDTQKLDGYERRTYGQTTWVGNEVVSASTDSATDGMFMKLFRYIGGQNSEGQKIKMTVPVATEVDAVGSNKFRYTMMFYVPGSNPPTPTNSDVKIMTFPSRTFYVKTFYTWFLMADNGDYMKEADNLREMLTRDNVAFDENTYYQVGYTSPFWPWKKHHEVWLEAA